MTLNILKPKDIINVVEDDIEKIIVPKLIAIYEGNNQIGTGFLIAWKAKTVLVTAKHCLYGHNFNEDPLDKGIFFQGNLALLKSIINTEIVSDDKYDIAAVYIDGFEQSRVFSFTSLRVDSISPEMVTIIGFLARDFKRDKNDGVLRPAPLCHTDVTVDYEKGFVAVKYLNRAITSKTGVKELTPRPAGLSGTVMLNTARLAINEIEICGLVTDERLRDGFVFGAHANTIADLLNKLVP